MGYSDFEVNHAANGRLSWQYGYLGTELQAYAERKEPVLKVESATERATMARELEDPAARINSDANAKRRDKIEHLEREIERCTVWRHEFGRAPDHEFVLTLADIVYFGIAP